MKTTPCPLQKIISHSSLQVTKSGSIIHPSVVSTVQTHPRPRYGLYQTLQNIQNLVLSYAILVATHIVVALGNTTTTTPEEGPSSNNNTELSPTGLSDIPKQGLLGSGSFGTVWKVNWQGQLCALKTVENSKSPGEGEVAMGLVHPNVVSTIAHQTTRGGESTQLSHILMELCWKTLEDGVRQKIFTSSATGYLDWAMVRKITLDIAKGLEYVHSRGYIHCDLKPANIFLCRGSDNQLVAKIGDFGLSLDLQGQQEVTVEQPGTIIISAPETLERKTAGVKSDVHSFGILLWMFLTGRIPYSGMDFEDVIDFVIEGIRPSIYPSWPTWVKSLLKDCWATDPSSRPFSGELVTRLEMAPNTSCPSRGPPPGFERHRLAPPPGFGPGPSRKPNPAANPDNSGILAIMPERPPGF